MQNVKGDIRVLSNRMANVELTLENQTNHNEREVAELKSGTPSSK